MLHIPLDRNRGRGSL